MSKDKRDQTALYVRLPRSAGEKLDRASEALGVTKKDLVAGLVRTYVDPDSADKLGALEAISQPRRALELIGSGASMGSYSFRPYDPPEVLTGKQAADLLQVGEALVLEMAQAGELPGRKLGDQWRFSREALLAWLARPESR